jgi:release factor glutamine methyltransferase
MTVLEAIQRSHDFLARKGVESPRLQAELLLAQVLGIARMKLYLNFDRTLSLAETDAYRGLVQRRGQREPLQHILGTVCFHGLELAVNRDVLIPRSETELLVEQAVRWIQARTEPVRVLDFGTGSGCIAIAIAMACPAARVWATDVSGPALVVARGNAGRHQVQERIEFLEGAGFNALPTGSRLDLVVSNPPYIASAEIESLQPEVRDYDPRLALDGGSDGLAFYRVLATEAGPWMNPGGAMLVEFGDDQGPAIRELMVGQDWGVDELVPDYSGRERILIARRSD